MSTPTIENCLQGIESKHILLDTCFFIDAGKSILLNGEQEYIELIDSFRARENVFVTIFPVAIEFYRGSDLIFDFEQKKNFLIGLVEKIIPIDPQIIENAYQLCLAYRKNGKDVEPTDIIIGATLGKYGDGVLLLTRNINHFPVKILTVSLRYQFNTQMGELSYIQSSKTQPIKLIRFLKN